MRGLLLLVVAIGVLLAPSEADARKRKNSFPSIEWGLRVGLNTIYNDNVLRLSGPDQDAFRRYDPGFRTPMETIDDGEMELSLAPSVQWRAPGNMMVNGYYRFKDVRRSKNDFTNYQTHSLSATVRPRVRGYNWSAKASVFTIPSFYLRVYRDRDYGTYEDSRFANWEYNGEFSVRPVESVWLSLQGGFGSYYYNEKFTEYDSEFTEFGAEARIATPWKPTVTARFTRRAAINVGKDQAFQATPSFDSEQVLEDNEYGDGDNNEDEFRLSIRSPLRITKGFLLDGSLSSKLRRRLYKTDRAVELDPFHRGRLDTRWEVSPALSWSVTPSLDLESYFIYEQRDSESDVTGVSRVKNFVRREVGFGLTYRLN